MALCSFALAETPAQQLKNAIHNPRTTHAPTVGQNGQTGNVAGDSVKNAQLKQPIGTGTNNPFAPRHDGGIAGAGNDDCTGATVVAVPSVTDDSTVGMGGDASPLCGSGAGATAPTIWFTFTGTGNTVTASLCGSNYDSTIHAYCGPCDSLFCITGNDDFCGLQSQISFCTGAGTQYWLRVGGFSSASGAVHLTMSDDGIACGPPACGGGGGCVGAPGVPNDCCVDATPIGEVTDMPFSNIGANGDGPASCVSIEIHDVWFLYTASCDGLVNIDLCGSGYDTALAVYDGSTCGSSPLIVCNDDSCGLQSSVIITAVAGNSYLIQIGGFAGSQGAGDITIACLGSCGTWPCDGSLLGDSNCDGLVDNGDIDCFVQALLDLSGGAWQACALAVNPDCDYDYVCTNDLNGDGVVDNADIDAFVACLITLPPAGEPCPSAGGGPALEGEPDCGLPVDTVNGGCNSVPPVFSPIECGQTYCGSAGVIEGTTRDTDWYAITTTTDTQLTWTAEASFPVLVGVVENNGVDDCAGVSAFRVFATGSPCVSTSVTTCVPAGTWWLFIAPSTFSGVPCESAYIATLTCDPCTVPTGACCLLGGECLDGVTNTGCVGQGGTYQGDGTLCSDVVCCNVVCDANDLQENEPDCGLPVDTVNGGCNSFPPVFSPIACGQSYCSTGGTIVNTTRDTDWYQIDLTEDTQVTWTGSAEFPLLIGIVENGGIADCAGVSAFRVFATGNPCDLISVTDCLSAGSWWLFAAPSTFSAIPCGSEYRVTLDCAPCSVPRGACCLIGGECTEGTTVGECGAAGGQYQGDGTLCSDVVCCNVTCDPDALLENEPDCGLPVDTVNGGCNSVPPVFSPIQCGQKYCGTGGTIVNTTRDTDWYELVTTAVGGTNITWSANAEFPVLVGVVENNGIADCAGVSAFRVFATGAPCQATSVSTTLPPGTWWLFVAPSTFSAIPCGSEYQAELTCTENEPNGACCLPGGGCSVLTAGECSGAGGSYQGDGTNCGSTYGANACGNAVIDISGTNAGPAGDDIALVVPLGFTFNYFGTNFTDVSIATNGYLQFGGSSADFTNDPIPNTLAPNNIVCPLWDDLNTAAGGVIWYTTSGTDFIVWWQDVGYFGGIPGTVNVECILHGATGCIEFRYGPTTLSSPSVGVEDGTGTVGTSVDPATAVAAGCYEFCPQGGACP